MAVLFGALTGFITRGLVAVGLNAALAGAASNVIVGAGLTVLGSVFRPKPQKLAVPDQQSVLNQSTAGRVRGYGRDLLGGIRAFWDSKDGTLYQIVMHHSGGVDAVEAIYFGDRVPPINEDGWVEGDTEGIFDDRVRFISRPGTTGQGGVQSMIDAWPGIWTTEHRLRGIAYTYAEFHGVREDHYAACYPEGANTAIRILARLQSVYDPADGSDHWTDNCSSCIGDFLTHPDGFPGINGADIDWPSFAAFKAVCAQAVPLRAGGTQFRYRLGGVYSLQDDPVDVLSKLMLTCDADLYLTPNAQIGIAGGVWTEPTVTITDRDILSFDLREGNDKLAAFNELKIVFRDPSADYEANEAPKWIDAADQSIRGVVTEDLTLDYVQWPAQAQRLAKIHAHRRNPRWIGSVSTNLVGLRAWDQRVIRLVIPEMLIDEPFYIERRALRTDLSGLDFDVYAFGPEAYAWNAATEEGVASPPPARTRPDSTIEVPVVDSITTPIRTIGATTGHVLFLTVDPPVRAGLDLEAQFRISPTGPWEGMSAPSDQLTATSGIVSDGEAYDVRFRWRVSSGVVSAWAAVLAVEIV